MDFTTPDNLRRRDIDAMLSAAPVRPEMDGYSGRTVALAAILSALTAALVTMCVTAYAAHANPIGRLQADLVRYEEMR